MRSDCRAWLKKAIVVATIGVLAACATPEPPPAPPPPPPPPPPPVVEVVPYRPIPPGGASYRMTIPQRGADGRRMTVNSNLEDNEMLWHFRSGWNVAALNCLDPQYQPILEGYRAFLDKHARLLATVNSAMDEEFRKRAGSRSDALRAREEHMTQVYNYFALPPARREFCNIALQVANESLGDPDHDPLMLARTGLNRVEVVFEDFYREYEKYRADAQAWDARYGERYGASQPGYVALYGAAGHSVGSSLVELGAPQVAGEVVDPATGGRIPLVAAPQDTVSTPVVQPVPVEGGSRQ